MDLIERLRARTVVTEWPSGLFTKRTELADLDCHEAADEIESLTAEVERKDEALRWYAEMARLARLIHSEGDKGRHALSKDGGERARAALTEGESE